MQYNWQTRGRDNWPTRQEHQKCRIISSKLVLCSFPVLEVVESKNVKNVNINKYFKSFFINIHFFWIEKEIDHLPTSKLKIHLVKTKDTIKITWWLLEGVGCSLFERSSLHISFRITCPNIWQIYNTWIGIKRFHFVFDNVRLLKTSVNKHDDYD